MPPPAGATVVWVASSTEVLGMAAIADEARPGAADALVALKALGVRCAMLTGVHRSVPCLPLRLLGGRYPDNCAAVTWPSAAQRQGRLHIAASPCSAAVLLRLHSPFSAGLLRQIFTIYMPSNCPWAASPICRR